MTGNEAGKVLNICDFELPVVNPLAEEPSENIQNEKLETAVFRRSNLHIGFQVPDDLGQVVFGHGYAFRKNASLTAFQAA